MGQVLFLPHFRHQLKNYLKRYRHLMEDVLLELENFDKRRYIYLGRGVYKIRLKSSDIPKGKSKSFRLLVLFVEIESIVVPLTLYFKGGREDMSKKEINRHLDIILFELRLY